MLSSAQEYQAYSGTFRALYNAALWELLLLTRIPGFLGRHAIGGKKWRGAYVAYSHDIIDETIDWCQKSDWAIIEAAWLLVSDSLDQVLESMLTIQTKYTIQSTAAADPNDNRDLHERNAPRELPIQAAKSAIPLVKLARILAKKASETILKKKLSAMGRTELNSGTMKQLYEAAGSMLIPLSYLSILLPQISHSAQIVRIDDQNELRATVNELPNDMESTLSALDSYLIPLLLQIEDEPPEDHLKSFFPTLKQSWDKASDHLMDVLLSFEVERIAI
ncbi:hypothetical protein PTTG_27911 [Puccinia triticina 1-1 BBBD Race 1]|uniref:Uncharacterized protein n=1 Tax=Puccinia triticina (isolate 1-1 / race 1 (BBBD)) TaxID=630390 RepID=A0A180GGW3_PUCT1|nr:hypothetical protein PTTG_27911 [Puccinia triticina 1-1 BBBD Race 1]